MKGKQLGGDGRSVSCPRTRTDPDKGFGRFRMERLRPLNPPILGDFELYESS